MSFLDYTNPNEMLPENKPGQSQFPADFGSRGAMVRGDEQRRAVQANKRVIRATNQAVRRLMKSSDPQSLAMGIQMLNNNPGALGIQKSEEINSRALAMTQQQHDASNMAIKMNPNMLDEQKRLAMTDRFGMTGATGNEVAYNKQREDALQGAREVRFQNNLSILRGTIKDEPRYTSIATEVSYDSSKTRGAVETGYGDYSFFTKPSRGPDGGVYQPTGAAASMKGPMRGVDAESRYTTAFGRFNSAFESDPETFGALRREFLANGSRAPRMDMAAFAEKSVEVVRLAKRFEKVLGIQVPKKPTSKDIIRLYTLLHRAGVTNEQPSEPGAPPVAIPVPGGRVLSERPATAEERRRGSVQR